MKQEVNYSSSYVVSIIAKTCSQRSPFYVSGSCRLTWHCFCLKGFYMIKSLQKFELSVFSTEKILTNRKPFHIFSKTNLVETTVIHLNNLKKEKTTFESRELIDFGSFYLALVLFVHPCHCSVSIISKPLTEIGKMQNRNSNFYTTRE